MNVQSPSAGQTRLILSTLADRLIFGDPDTFDSADARELASLMPPPSRWQRRLGGWVAGRRSFR